MSTGSGGKPDGESQPGRPAAETPQRLVVRSIEPGEPGESAAMAANDTAVASTSRPGVGPTVGDTVGGTLPPQSAFAAELVGVTLSGRYLVTRKVGQGGMGAVYEATHTLIGKRVAVKVLLEKYARREAIVQRLEQEARLASSCQNEHIIDITDFGTTEDGRTFVVMEYLEGESLSECLSREMRLPEQRILQIISQAASALAAAHAKGIVHRDIKPENLFLLRRKDQDFVKVVDFGISKSLRASDEAEEPPRLTQTGMVLGTPLYMSPEQARGDDELDARVDIYALGVIMYEAATGRVPFIGNNYLSVISQVLNEEPRSPRALRPDLSEEFEAIVMRAMDKDREARYASANALLSDVTALLDDPTRSTERAKITGPRRKVARGRSPLRIAIWFTLVAVVIAAVVTTVMMLFGGSEAIKDRRTVVAPPPVPIDAAPPPPLDALEAPTLEITIETVPPDATIQQDGVDKGTAPITTKLVVDNHFTEFVASAPGYEDKTFKINAVVDKKTHYKIALKKLPPSTAPVRAPPRSGSGSGKATGDTHDPTNRELGPNPFKAGGTARP
ncbi:MAG: PEGA domain-containing protein [Deltaproteobacteria bacterium]|nr:MAG: PEGA domain-containing protein [Deltaproteobacteria bacterium]TMQ21318.1 MAG: PEGA domain-containing protein [Deltaproteobacteria bacterium]